MVAMLAPTGANAQDGIAILKKVQSSYLGLKSYSQKVSSTVTTKIAGRTGVTGQTSELRYQQPNKVYMVVSTAQVGSFVSYNNGHEMFVYRGRINAYVKRPGKSDVKSYVVALKEYGVGTMLDPLAFLTGEPIQSAFSSATMKPAVTIDGVKCDLVIGRLAPRLAGKAKSATASFWIDKGTNLLRKIQIATGGLPAIARVTSRQNGKQVVKNVQIQIDSTLTMNIQEAKVNPLLTDASFSYQPPKDAIEQHVEKALKR